ncbi:MAG: hypothetical protein C0614_04325 [Desulfuromonas sp.]|nr:MAG: hypothetical protein C0614_04325 [Desulfuromonas sp.]
MKSCKWLFWSLLFMLIFLAIDQFLVRVPPLHPAHAAFSRFYQDFRSRLCTLTFGRGNLPHQKTVVTPAKPGGKKIPAAKSVPDKTSGNDQPSIETVIEEKKHLQPSSSSQPERYIYSDSAGVLQFADSLEEVPPQFRDQAQKL